MQLDDLDFADDLALLSFTHPHQQMQVKTTTVAAALEAVGLNIHMGNRKILKYNTENTKPITFGGEALEHVQTFTYSIIDKCGESDVDLKSIIGKPKTAFLQLKNICNSKQLSVNQYPSHNLQCERQHSQLYCKELKLAKPLQPSSRKYKYLSTIIYSRYSVSIVDRILSVTAYRGREQPRSQLKRKLGKDVVIG
ncbi:unnamed protein product [Schistosoma margrebowiei]|uniref:Uncharacterized protein n=1 Tax=Schistosoma margrebowiei TaxID=48269 RepID=A0A183LTF0_9TREM|nr:unnamed protein product [Schistosoma margrebowiei]